MAPSSRPAKAFWTLRRSAWPKQMHDEKYHRQDQENVNEESCDVKRDEGKGPYENKQHGKTKKDEPHT
jgi:hypothetical protein